jgi:hypothetical protein
MLIRNIYKTNLSKNFCWAWHLGEDEDAVIAVAHGRQQVVEDGELAAVADLVVAQAVVLDTLKRIFY